MNEQNDFLTLKKRHSRLAIVAVVLAIISSILFALFILSQMMTMGGDRIFMYKMFVFFTVIFVLLQLIGLGLGATGLFSKQTKKLFPIISTILNGILFLLGIVLLSLLINAGVPKYRYRPDVVVNSVSFHPTRSVMIDN